MPHDAAPGPDAEEVSFWRRWLETRGGDWPEEFAQRLDPGAPLHWELANLLPPGAVAEILDVGAGPLTSLGKVAPGRTLRITAVDPLAEAYSAMLVEQRIAPPVRTMPGDAAGLLGQFGADRFDLVHARNAIDHTADAPRAVREMLAVARPGGAVYLAHARNEGERQGYGGMHRWNFDVETVRGEAHFILWNRSLRVDLTEELSCAAGVTVHAVPEWINVTIRKRRA